MLIPPISASWPRYNPPPPIYLLTENCFDGSYLVADWIRNFHGTPSYRGVLIRDIPERGRMAEKALFHREYRNHTELSPQALQDVYGLYSNTSGYAQMHGLLEASIRLFGIPDYPEPAEKASPVRFIGSDVNSPEMRSWLEGVVAHEPKSTFFIYLDRILKPWWMELTGGRIINAHPAALPYARGMWAIEQVAKEKDPKKLKRSAGATVHFVDAGIDTGSIIQVVGLDPFRFQTLPELSAASLRLATSLLFRTAQRLIENPDEELRGVPVDPKALGTNYRARDFDDLAAAAAIRCFAEMRSEAVETEDFLTRKPA